MVTRLVHCSLICVIILLIDCSLIVRPSICDHFVDEGVPSPDVFFYKSKRLFVFYEDKNWTEAYKSCKRVGLKLLSIQSNQENFAIGEYLKNRIYEGEIALYTWTYLYIWTGGKRVNDTWRWVAQKSPILFTSWEKGEPNNDSGVEDCLEIRSINIGTKPLWGDAHCKEKKRFICENPIGGLG